MSEPIINSICLSTDRRHVEGWNNGNRVRTCSVEISGLFGAVQDVLEYLRAWSGQEPRIDKELKAIMDRADATFTKLAYGKTYQ